MPDQNTWLLFGIAVAQALTAFFSWSSRQAAIETKQIAVETKENVVTIEKATNSMKDALVAATAKAADAEGFERARKEGEVKADTVAQIVAAKAERS